MLLYALFTLKYSKTNREPFNICLSIQNLSR